jgi:choline dehydrogenase-like flavoprotein
MLINFIEYDSSEPLECDVCIIGGGPAGITIAKSLIGSDLNVVLLESGALEVEIDAQALSDYSTVGDYFVEACRARVLGGSSSHWGGASAPFSEGDMLVRNWVPDSGWPITRAELEAYYKETNTLLELGDYDYSYPLSAQDEWMPAYGNGLQNAFFRRHLPPTHFGVRFREELDAAENVRIVYNASVTNINASQNAGSVNSISFQSLGGKQGTVNAKAYIIAVGAMETPRLLLMSSDVQPEGLGNGYGMVGRCFMMHPHRDLGMLTYDSPELVTQLVRPQHGDVQFVPIVQLSEAFQAQEKILGGSIQLLPMPNPESGSASVRRLLADLKRGEWPNDFGGDLWNVLTDLDDVIGGSGVGESGRARLWAQTEQAPSRESRIFLDDSATDVFGNPMLVAESTLQEIDHKTIRTLGMLFASEVGRLGLGRVQLSNWVTSEDVVWPEYLETGCHHLGGARMSLQPEDGVVNTDCRVHGIDNLYVASSAVFPTGSYVNPTMTIVALSLRLTDHLKATLGKA